MTLAIILIMLLLVWIFWPRIQAWLLRMFMRRVQRQMFRAAGMEEPRRQKQQKKQRQNPREQSRHRERHPAKMMQEVAEDTDFTEIQEFHFHSETTSHTTTEHPDGSESYTTEEQVSDAEYTEIKR